MTYSKKEEKKRRWGAGFYLIGEGGGRKTCTQKSGELSLITVTLTGGGKKKGEENIPYEEGEEVNLRKCLSPHRGRRKQGCPLSQKEKGNVGNKERGFRLW